MMRKEQLDIVQVYTKIPIVHVTLRRYELQCRLNYLYYRPQTKLRQGNVFTSVCQEFCPQGGACVVGGMHGRGHVWWGTCVARGVHDRGVCVVGVCLAGGGGHVRVPTQPGKMRVHLENLEISWNFEKFNKYHGK